MRRENRWEGDILYLNVFNLNSENITIQIKSTSNNTFRKWLTSNSNDRKYVRNQGERQRQRREMNKSISFIDKTREREKNEFYEIKPPLLLFSPLCTRTGGVTQHYIKGMTTTMMNYTPLLPIRIQNLTPMSVIGQTQEASLLFKKIALFSAAPVIITMGKRPAPLSLPFYIRGMKRRDR
jgi:hypothetical protein